MKKIFKRGIIFALAILIIAGGALLSPCARAAGLELLGYRLFAPDEKGELKEVGSGDGCLNPMDFEDFSVEIYEYKSGEEAEDSLVFELNHKPAINLGDLVHKDRYLKIAVPEGYFIATAYIMGDELSEEDTPVELCKLATIIKTEDTEELIIPCEKLTVTETNPPETEGGEAEERIVFNRELLSSTATADSSGNMLYFLRVELGKYAVKEGESYSADYNEGEIETDFPYLIKKDENGAEQTSFPVAFNSEKGRYEHKLLPIAAENIPLAAAASKGFDGWRIEYENGSSFTAQPGDIIVPQGSFTATALWKDIIFVTVTAGSAEKDYDGAELKGDGYSVSFAKAGDEDKYEVKDVTVSGGITEPGTAAAIPSGGALYPKDSDALLSEGSYFISYENGSLTVKGITIDITASSEEHIYDAKPFSNDSYSVDESKLLKDHSVESVTVTGSITNAGTAKNTASNAVFVDKEGNDVSRFYVPNYIDGTLTVKKAPITVWAKAPAAAEYSGKLLLPAECEISGMPASGHKLIPVYEGGLILTGEGEATLTGLKIEAADGTDVTDNYEITIKTEDGANKVPVKVIPCTKLVTITAKDYSGNVGDKLDDIGFTVTGLLSGDRLEASVTTDTTDATENGKTIIASYKILNREGSDVTACYSNLKKVNGKLVLRGTELRIYAISATKKYDGKPLIAAEISGTSSSGRKYVNGYSYDGLLAGHTLTAEVTGRITNVGEVTTRIFSVKVTDEDGKDVTGMYTIIKVEGRLRITAADGTASPSPSPSATPRPNSTPTPRPASTPRPTPTPNPANRPGDGGGGGFTPGSANGSPLTITAGSRTWTYDGEAHNSSDYTATGLKDGDKIIEVSFAEESTITDAGRTENIIKGVKIVDRYGQAVRNDKYNITLKPGSLEVTKFSLVIKADPENKDYDGQPLNSEYTAGELASESHTLTVEVQFTTGGREAKGIEVGTYTKSIKSFTIMDGDKDVSGNYNVTLLSSTNTVTEGGGLIPEPDSRPAAGKVVKWALIVTGSAAALAGVAYVIVKGRRDEEY